MTVANKGSLVENLLRTLWVKKHVYNMGHHIVITTKNVTYIGLFANMHLSIDQSLILLECDLRTLALTYITPKGSLDSAAFMRGHRSLLDGNNPAKPFCTTFYNFLQDTWVMISANTVYTLCSRKFEHYAFERHLKSLSCKHASRPIRARVLSWLLIKGNNGL